MASLVRLAEELREAVDPLSFASPVTHTYTPLRYAWEPHRAYLERFGQAPKRVVLLGMNPGPYGMAQTGVPFGEISAVRDWMGIHQTVSQPSRVHPKRPVTGFACERSEVSGRRLWGLMAARYGSPEAFFAEHFVLNYCPLVWMSATGANLTPDKLTAAEQMAVDTPCRVHLRAALELLQPRHAVGVGAYAMRQLATVTRPGDPWRVSTVLHPSPASPAANRGWAEAATRTLLTDGIWT
jgi:single-strand selective monofunctional uracil DNA glycosylase